MAQQDLSKLQIRREPGASPVRRKSRRWMWVLVSIAVLLGVFSAYSKFAREPEVETVVVGTAYPYQAQTLLNATGYVVAQRKAAVASKATGRLEWLGVAEGSRVKTHEIIARLENKDVSAAMEQAAAGVKVARANLEQGMAELHDAEAAWKRSRDLVAKNFISQASLDSAEARHNKARAAISSLQASIAVAEAGLKGAQVAVEQTLIRAPFDGVVLTKAANVGDVVTPFSSAADSKGAVVTMADMSTLEVEADVSESNLQKIRLNQPSEVQLDAFPELRFRAVVSRTVPTMDRAKATMLVKIRFVDLDPRILPEMSAKVAFLDRAMADDKRKPVAVVQPAALQTRDGKSVVYVVSEGKLRETPVQSGEKIGDLIEVSGIKPGDKVVLKPAADLRDGGAVRVKK